ncbi:asparagine--tRNA ligase, cytoplasmic 1 isoform X2 [Cryptomeria japonica]|uniref:asparagine--tRNA ligase, cytoplasmic 1 isoform X2 n=1 Tax=Cryptomeria japonica TaxID=3369 RepID=UPI0025ACA348|nr:asparagine--tRNA ligase, cytoplasmic 1 isoform X2 [Cryptomeria japonica]
MTGCLLLLFMATEESLTSAMENMGVASEVAQAKYSRRVLIKSIIKRPDGEQGLSGQSVVVGGWVRTSRAHGGELTQPPDGKEQKVELKLTKVLGVGTVDPRKYPIAKTYLPLEHLRSYVHLRARTNTISAAA